MLQLQGISKINKRKKCIILRRSTKEGHIEIKMERRHSCVLLLMLLLNFLNDCWWFEVQQMVVKIKTGADSLKLGTITGARKRQGHVQLCTLSRVLVKTETAGANDGLNRALK